MAEVKKLSRENALLLVIDIQERLAKSMENLAFEAMLKNTKILIQGCDILNVPIMQSLQYKKGLGESVAGLFESESGEIERVDFEKRIFSCCYEGSELLENLSQNRQIKQILIAGMEAHICVYQTARDLLSMGYEVAVLGDCVISRNKDNKQNALDLIMQNGGAVLNVESALFDLLGTSEASEFEAISNLIK